jgi:hypothetical protein
MVAELVALVTPTDNHQNHHSRDTGTGQLETHVFKQTARLLSATASAVQWRPPLQREM